MEMESCPVGDDENLAVRLENLCARDSLNLGNGEMNLNSTKQQFACQHARYRYPATFVNLSSQCAPMLSFSNFTLQQFWSIKVTYTVDSNPFLPNVGRALDHPSIEHFP